MVVDRLVVGAVVVVMIEDWVVDDFLGLNLSSLDFIFSTALCAKGLLSLFALELLFLDGTMIGAFSTTFSSFLSWVIFCPFRILNKSANDLGLTVVVVVVLFVGRVRILNKLNLVVDSVVEGVDLSLLFIFLEYYPLLHGVFM